MYRKVCVFVLVCSYCDVYVSHVSASPGMRNTTISPQNYIFITTATDYRSDLFSFSIFCDLEDSELCSPVDIEL